jgi:hypothetical protein
MGIFGGVRAQEFASCWRIEKKFLRFDAGTGFLSGWLRLRVKGPAGTTVCVRWFGQVTGCLIVLFHVKL